MCPNVGNGALQAESRSRARSAADACSGALGVGRESTDSRRAGQGRLGFAVARSVVLHLGETRLVA